jgi:CheY-like chemotaxis protein
VTKTVLVIEDEDSLREVTAVALELEGYQVEAVRSGPAALAWCATHWPDALVLDLRMWPLMGPEVLEALWTEHGRVPPTVIVSAYILPNRTRQVTQAALQFAPAARVISKPFELDDLAAALAVVIAQVPPNGGASSC